MKNYIYTIACFLFIGNSVAQQTPAAKQSRAYTIEGATAHLGNGKVIENSLIMFSNGKIDFVGNANMKISRKGIVINAEGKHVYPGFIVANTTLGLGEIDAVKASIDEREIGTYNPHIRSIIAYNAESRVIESMRPNGVLIVQTTPRGGIISGTSSIVQLDAWNWEDAIVKENDAIHMNWPSSISFSGKWWTGEPRVAKPNKKYIENLDEFTSYIREAKAYLQGNQSEENLPFKAMEGLFNGSQKLFIHINGEREITDAINLVKKEGIQKVVLVHAKGADKVVNLLINSPYARII